MKKILSMVMSLVMTFTFTIPAFADGPSYENSTTKEYVLEPSYENSTTTIIDEDGQQTEANEKDLSVVKTSISFKSKGIWAEVYLSSMDEVMYTKVEGTARLYVNGIYVASEDFAADPILPVYDLQAGTYVGDEDDVESGDLVTVYFEGTFDTLQYDTKSFEQMVSMTIE